MGKKCVLWDLDGTILNSGEGIIYSLRKMMEAYKLPEQPEHLMRKAIGPPIEEVVCEGFGLKDQYRPEMLTYLDEVYMREGMEKDFLYPGITECLEMIHTLGAVNCIATMKPDYMREYSKERHPALAGLIDSWIGWLNIPGQSKKEDLFQRSLQAVGLETKDAIVVGDRASDITAAKAKGILSVAVLYGFGTKEELEKGGPDYVAESVEGLCALLKELIVG